GADCIILGGDLLPTWIPHPVSLITGTADFERDLDEQRLFLETYLGPAFNAFLASHPTIRLLYIPGNHDWDLSMDLFSAMLPEALCLHQQEVFLDGLSFAGYGCVTDSSFWVKDCVRRDLKESSYVPSRYAFVSSDSGLVRSLDGAYALERPSMEEELAGMSLRDPRKTICVFHSPPYDSGLDTLFDGSPIGSRAVRRFIDDNQPLISLHGHIHEAPYLSGSFHRALNRTVSVNPGHGRGGLHAVFFDTEDPEGTLEHTIFGRGHPKRSRMSSVLDRSARRLRAAFMEKVLTLDQIPGDGG
ncbi:MAG: metallophosphoesterase, partial [Desulfomonilia bacterium]|nr:metallophosphoesterase [Desulfomonilia bacterium]